MAEGAGTSQRSVFLAKRDDATESELHRFLEIRPRNPVRAARGLGSPLSADFEAMPLSSIHQNVVERTWF
jgi:hypothetical protein